MRRLLVLTAVVALALAAAGCGDRAGGTAGPDPGQEGQARPPQERASAAGGAAAAGLPDLYDQVSDSLSRLSRRCMEERGFTVHPPTSGSPLERASGYPFREPLDRDDLAEHGYGLGLTVRDQGGEEDQAPRPDPFNSQPPEVIQAYVAEVATMGTLVADDGTELRVPVAGCRFEVNRAVFGDAQAFHVLTNFLLDRPNRVRKATAEDLRVVDATRQWAACLEAAGFAGLADPDEAYDMALRFYADRGAVPSYSDAAQQREIALATADEECARRHGLDTTMREVWTAKTQSYTAEEEARLAALRGVLETALTTAQQLLGES